MNFILAIGLFSCYSSVVSPNEAKDETGTRNYRYFFNRYVQLFYRSQPYLEIRRLTDRVSSYIDSSHLPDRVVTPEGTTG